MGYNPVNPAKFAYARDYQKTGAAFVLDVLSWDNKSLKAGHRAALLADDPGLGKSLEALMVVDGLGARRTLVIAPAVARVAWPIELRKHLPDRLKDLRIPTHGAMPGMWLDAPDLFLVLSYDMFSQPVTARRWLPALRAVAWDLLILDECHYLKGDSNRAHAIYGLRSGHKGLQAAANRVLLLSGTPCPNHAAELFPHYTTFWRDLLHHDGQPLGQTDFEERYTHYTDGPWGRAIHGSREQSVLREAFAPVILRRRREDVLDDLPPMTIQDVPVPAPSSGALDVKSLRAQVDDLMSAPIDGLVMRLLQEAPALATLRRVLGEEKTAAAAEWIRERMTFGVEKMLVFAWHTKVLARLREQLLDFNPVTISGDTSPEDRAEAVRKFQNDPEARIFLGQTRAAGTAITLTKASEVAIVEPSWTPSDNEQAIARAWRLGQTNPVLVSFLYVPGTLDQRIMRAFRRKAQELCELYQKEGVDA